MEKVEDKWNVRYEKIYAFDEMISRKCTNSGYYKCFYLVGIISWKSVISKCKLIIDVGLGSQCDSQMMSLDVEPLVLGRRKSESSADDYKVQKIVQE